MKCLAQVDKPVEALQSFEKGLAILRKQALDHPDSFLEYVQIWLAYTLERMGVLLATSGKPAAALAACEEALAIRQKRIEARPSIIWYRSELVGCLTRLGTVQRRAGRSAEAVATFRRAIIVLEQLPTLTPRSQYSLACCHAQLAGLAAEAGSGLSAEQGKTEAERAMSTLRQAYAAGFGNLGIPEDRHFPRRAQGTRGLPDAGKGTDQTDRETIQPTEIIRVKFSVETKS